jgi:hypothetical protein
MNKTTLKLMSIAWVFLLLTGTAKAQTATGGAYKLEQSVIASGGGTSTGTSAGAANTFSISGTIGQSAAGTEMSAAPYAQTGGFWAALASAGQIEPPSISTSFSPTTVNVGEVSTLTITLTNPSANTVDLSGVGVTDSFPAGLQVDASPMAVNTCGGTFSANADETSIGLVGGTISVNGSCLISVRVKAITEGQKVNTTGAVTSTNGGTGETATAILTVNQPAETYSVSGTISYGITSVNQTPALVPGVNLNAAGSSVLSAISNSSGAYQLPGLTESGNYTVTPTKTGDVNGIDSLDAARIQQYLVGLTTLTTNQLIAADVDNNGVVNSLDAARIQQYLVQISTPNIIGQWKFVPVNRQYASISSNLAGQDYEAVLVGDVSGNWTAPGAPVDISQAREERQALAAKTSGRVGTANSSTGESAVQGANIAVSLPSNAIASTGNNITVPVVIGAIPTGSSIESFDFSVYYDPAVLQPASPAGSHTGTFSSGCSVLVNSPAAGRVIVSGACGGTPIMTGSGTLYNLTFTVIGAANQTSSLTFVNPADSTNTLMFNNGTPSASTTSGQFIVTGPTAASVSVTGRVTNNQGRGIGNVLITMTDSAGNQRQAQTTSFGYYKFDSVAAGETITLTAKARRVKFVQSSIVRTTNQSVSDADFVSEP